MLNEIVGLAEASKLWGLDESTFRKNIGKKFIEGEDCKLVGKSWVFLRSSVQREYGVPEHTTAESVQKNEDSLFLTRESFGTGNGFSRIYDLLERSVGKTVHTSILIGEFNRGKRLPYTLVDYKMFTGNQGYSLLLHLSLKGKSQTFLIPDVIMFDIHTRDTDELLVVQSQNTYLVSLCTEKVGASSHRMYFPFEKESKAALTESYGKKTADVLHTLSVFEHMLVFEK